MPTPEQQLAGQVNLGMANGGIVGLKKGTFGTGLSNFFSNLGSDIKDIGSSIYKDVVYGPGPNLPSETHGSLANLDNPFGKTSYDYGPFTLSTDGTTAEQHFSSSDDEEERSKNYANYKRAIGAGAGEGVSQDYVRGRTDARAENFLGGQNYDAIVSQNEAAPGSHDMSVYNNPLTSKVINGTTLVGYENEDGLFQPISYNDANRALAAGIVDNPNIMGTNTDNTGGNEVVNTGNNVSTVTGGDGSTYEVYVDDDGVTRYTSNTGFANANEPVNYMQLAEIGKYDDYEFVPVTTITDQTGLTEYDQYVKDQDIPIVGGFAVFDKNKHTMDGFEIGDGRSNNSIPVYVDDNGVVRYKNGQELNLPSSDLEEIKNAAGYVPAAPVWSAEKYPVATDIFGTIGTVVETVSGSNANAFSNLATNFSYNKDTGNFDTEQQDNIIKMYSDVVNGDSYFAKPDGTADVNYETQSLASIQRQLDFFKALRQKTEEEVKSFVQELKTWSDFLGTYGQPGAAYGGAIKGYAMGGMGQAPDLPSGLLKSTEDGMADTIPAQMGNQPINLSGGEYIMDAETVAFLGNGNTDAGAQKLDDFRENLRMAKNGGEDQGNQINSENFLGRLQQMGVA